MKSKPHKAIDLLGTLSLFAAIGLGVFYLASGQSVDEDGFLQEEFWALGMAWIFMFSAIFFALLSALMWIRSRKK